MEKNQEKRVTASAPLADRMRPMDFDEFLGQDDIVGEGKLLRRAIEKDELRSIILWGPPGSGKTTLAHIIAHHTKAKFIPFSAVLAGIKEVKEVMAQAEEHRKMFGQKTILFIDEIHRFNKAQQDAFLPYVEKGIIILIGATTENPSFEVIAPLLSRSKVYVLRPLSQEMIEKILKKALTDERGLMRLNVSIEDTLLKEIAILSQGDARFALNILEFVCANAQPGEAGRRKIAREMIIDALQKTSLYYDKDGEEHYNLISALHKSLRNSDPDAALYWLARMLQSGEDPLYIARRMVRFASEDVGVADPQALQVAIAAKEAIHFLGIPEGDLALAEAAVYLAMAPKSNSLYEAYGKVTDDIRKGEVFPVPLHLRNAPTGLMKALKYGEGYKYAHDFEDAMTDMDCLPEKLRSRKYYTPTARGFEKLIRERLEKWEAFKKRNKDKAGKK
ncbi:MAG: replication-associated recombination protein A [Acidobacteriota bacterium]